MATSREASDIQSRSGDTDVESLKTSCGYAKHALLGLPKWLESLQFSSWKYISATPSVLRMWLAEKKLEVLGTDAEALLGFSLSV